MKLYIKAGVDWSYYNDPESSKYLPPSGEGDTLASQIVTAYNKLIYKWYNDGDVFDNTAYYTSAGRGLKGWANDLSSYANWLYRYCPQSQKILLKVYNIRSESDYENLLKDLYDMLSENRFLEKANKESTKGSIYDCDGPFEFVEEPENDEDDPFDGWNYGDDEEEEEEEEYY